MDFYTDAALGAAVDDADLLLLGADAIGGTAWINKAGTQLLAAAAAHQRGLPVHVVATSDKLVMPSLWPHLVAAPRRRPRKSGPRGAGRASASAIPISNRFHSICVTTVITDIGVLGVDMVPDGVRRRSRRRRRAACVG